MQRRAAERPQSAALQPFPGPIAAPDHSFVAGAAILFLGERYRHDFARLTAIRRAKRLRFAFIFYDLLRLLDDDPRLRIPPWARRLLTRGLATIPVVFVAAVYGESGTGKLIVFSQVVLSMQLPFAVVPLVWFVSYRQKMGVFAISRGTAILAWAVAGLDVVLNAKLL